MSIIIIQLETTYVPIFSKIVYLIILDKQGLPNLNNSNKMQDHTPQSPPPVEQVLSDCCKPLIKFLVEHPQNVLTESGLRYLGFVNDVGEACKSLIPKPMYYGSYLVTGLYCMSDILLSPSRLLHQLKTKEDVFNPEWIFCNPGSMSLTNRKMLDTSIWHLFATISVTPFIIHKSKTVSKYMLNKTNLPINIKTTFGPALIGLCLIPIIVPPIDNLFHVILNSSLRHEKEKQPIQWHGIYSFLNDKHT